MRIKDIKIGDLYHIESNDSIFRTWALVTRIVIVPEYDDYMIWGYDFDKKRVNLILTGRSETSLDPLDVWIRNVYRMGEKLP